MYMERIEWFEEDYNPKVFFLTNVVPLFLFVVIFLLVILGFFLLITYLGIPIFSWPGFILGCSGAIIFLIAVMILVMSFAFGKKGIFQYGLSDDGITIMQKIPDPFYNWPIKIAYNDIESIEILSFNDLSNYWSRIIKYPFQGRFFESFFSMSLLDIILSKGRRDTLIIHLKEGKLIYYKKVFVLGDKNKISFTVEIKPKDIDNFVSKIKAHLNQ